MNDRPLSGINAAKETLPDLRDLYKNPLGKDYVKRSVLAAGKTIREALRIEEEKAVHHCRCCGVKLAADEYARLTGKLAKLNDRLNIYLAQDYGIDVAAIRDRGSRSRTSATGKSDLRPLTSDFSKFLESHQPFHWFIEFYGIMKSGGFDSIVGNPPYVEYKKVMTSYCLPKEQYQNT